MTRLGDSHVSTWRTNDPAEAEAAVMTTYQLDHRLVIPSPEHGQFDMELHDVRIGSSTAGLLSYGAGARMLTSATHGYHVNLTLQGRAAGASNGAEIETAVAGEGLVYESGTVADARWFRGSRVLALLLPEEVVERQLESLLGHRVRERLVPELKISADGLANALAPAAQLVLQQLVSPTPTSVLPLVQRHVEALLVDSFLLAHRHNYSEELQRPAPPARRLPIQRAIDLLEERPECPWTTVGLASEVHLSVRALQDGFKRSVDTAPMAYLRGVRLRRARAALTATRPGEATVQEVARRFGILHQGRFSVAYREEFGESPSATLARPVP